jgi:hypothetical protein
MRSVRLDPELDRKVQRAAAIKGETVSEFIRRAVAARADETIGVSNRELLADVIGIVRSGGGGVAERTGEAFTELLEEERARR